MVLERILRNLGFNNLRSMSSFKRLYDFLYKLKDVEDGKTSPDSWIYFLKKGNAAQVNNPHFSNTNDFVNKCQNLFLRDKIKNVKNPLTGDIETKSVKKRIENPQILQLLEKESDNIKDCFQSIGFLNKIEPRNPSTEFQQIRLLGMNSVLCSIYLDGLKESIETGKIKLANDCKILLLGGTHTNSMSATDEMEVDMMERLVYEKLFNKDYNLHETRLTRTIQICKIETEETGQTIARANTIDTIEQANKNYNPLENTLYVGIQPTFERQFEDIISKGIITENTSGFAPSFNYLTSKLETFESNLVEEHEIAKEEDIAKKIKDQAYSRLIDSLSRTLYSRAKILEQGKTLAL